MLVGARVKLKQVDKYAKNAPVLNQKHSEKTPLYHPVKHP